jgi:LysR family transcriptional regulator, cyn operon transcriptional activator
VLPEARWGDEDPTRRQLAERTQHAGITIRPRIEVQHAGAALELAARGLGDTLVTRALLDTLGYGARLASVPLDPPLHESFAFIRRRNSRLSPATRALMTHAQHHLGELAREPS